MLSPNRDDEDDDTHLCIKCNTTLIGIDNYVKHRKERCGKKYDVTKTPKPPEMPSLEPFELPYSLEADFFFQSLELQSSVKKTRLSPPPQIPVPTKSSLLLDRKTSAAIASTSRDIPNMSPLETNLRGEDWIGGHSLVISNSEDNQTKLINAVARISGAAKKDITTTSSYNMEYNDYKGDEESDEASEDSEDEEEDEPPASGAKWKPPVSHTGGKWHPASPEQEEWDEPEHTGGKWKPTIASDLADDYDAPPPGHTKGKWVPGAQDPKTQIMQTQIHTKTSVQYWCGPCNRRLASRAIYEKHLMSNLHMKKVLPENDLEYSGHLGPPKFVPQKRATRPSQYINNSIYQPLPKKEKVTEDNKEKDNSRKKRRKRKHLFTHCTGCRSRVRLHFMGKHLISHYHFRKATDVDNEVYRKLIIDHIDSIVHQSPFQCSPCKFYTNWKMYFTQHWNSNAHIEKMASIEGRIWCSFCKFECLTSEEMFSHITSSEHEEVVAVINRSMPIILRKKSVLTCPDCLQEFRYNFEIKRHCLKTGHKLPRTATDSYQDLHKCNYCKEKFKSSLTLAGHLKSKHKQKSYVCLLCSKNFDTQAEAKFHRQTSDHIVRRKEKAREKGELVKEMTKKCPYCINLYLKNILDLKEHIKVIHPELRKKCSKCGMSFVLSQEVTQHVKSNACQFRPYNEEAELLWSCSQCLFTTESQSECFYHEILHTDPITTTLKKGDKEINMEKYTCLFCPKSFTKMSLRNHIRQHTLERPFICTICGANFTRQSSLANHMKKEHDLKTDKTAAEVVKPETKEDLKCSSCSKVFSNKTFLVRHLATPCQASSSKSNVIRNLRCPYELCTYMAATTTQLFRHRKTHGERVKHHECTLCEFKTNQASHMKRHMVYHQGIKPYACPHCSFTTASLENLRKHVFKRHPQLFLYTCPECKQFKTNMAKELRIHLVVEHPDKYTAVTAMETVKTQLKIKDEKLA